MIFLCLAVSQSNSNDQAPLNVRRPQNDAEARFWLENMVWRHRFSLAEIAAATGWSEAETTAMMARLNILGDNAPPLDADGPLLVLPYPGGRHPRIGFLDGAVQPQRETKFSVFVPWDKNSYVVADVPEAIWVEIDGVRELLYLAHTHIPTMWTRLETALPPQEWRRAEDGALVANRVLPNQVAIQVTVRSEVKAVRMEMQLTNGSDKVLKGLVVQNCVMFKGAPEFALQTNDNKIFRDPYVACRSSHNQKWVISAWEKCRRVWGNELCPCMHSDPQFPDCAPGEVQRLRGWLSFYEGDDLESELRRIEETGWRR
jgi:hypothetical protein